MEDFTKFNLYLKNLDSLKKRQLNMSRPQYVHVCIQQLTRHCSPELRLSVVGKTIKFRFLCEKSVCRRLFHCLKYWYLDILKNIFSLHHI